MNYLFRPVYAADCIRAVCKDIQVLSNVFVWPFRLGSMQPVSRKLLIVSETFLRPTLHRKTELRPNRCRQLLAVRKTSISRSSASVPAYPGLRIISSSGMLCVGGQILFRRSRPIVGVGKSLLRPRTSPLRRKHVANLALLLMVLNSSMPRSSEFMLKKPRLWIPKSDCHLRSSGPALRMRAIRPRP